VTTDDIARAVRAATAHLRAHPEDGRVADRPATVVVADELCCRATDPLGHTVVTDMPAELGGADTGPTPGDPAAHGPRGLRGHHPGHAVVSESDHRALVDWAERHSPVSTAARRELPVAVELDLGAAPPEG
jgi:hypothetical protein